MQRLAAFIIILNLFISCNDESKRLAEIERDQNKKLEAYNQIQNAWNFDAQPVNSASQSLVSDWAEWRELLNELSQKPQSSIGAFKRKSKILSQKATLLSNRIPLTFSKPEIRSRISVLTTKINSLDLYMNLDEISSDKVIASIHDINQELVSLQMQFDEIVKKNLIPLEEGEADMIRMLDTTRAVPTKPEILLPQ